VQNLSNFTLNAVSRLVVGGHSFIAELGNDPAIGFDEQLALVAACLEAGITSFDTTYEPERVALGRVFAELNQRPSAQIIAWNFFVDPYTGDHLVPCRPYQKSDLELLLAQLQSEYIDLMVVHLVGDPRNDARQIDVVRAWKASGRVRTLGIWDPVEVSSQRFGGENAFDFMVFPRNFAQPSTEVFSAARVRGWRTFATSPFGRGWLLDQLWSAASKQAGAEVGPLRVRLADALLRFSLCHPYVDHLVVGIRKLCWIKQNLLSAGAGPLSDEELQWLRTLLTTAGGAK